jgi:hypothetical protein
VLQSSEWAIALAEGLTPEGGRGDTALGAEAEEAEATGHLGHISDVQTLAEKVRVHQKQRRRAEGGLREGCGRAPTL